MVKKNILFLMGTYPSYGGVEKVTTVLANRFIEDGHCVTIASFIQPKNEFAKLYLSDKCNLLSLECPILSIKNIKKLREYVKNHNINVFINQLVIPFYVTLVWKLALIGINCKIYSVHHNKPDTNKRIQDLDLQINVGKNYLKIIRYLVREISRLSLAFCVKSSHKFILLSPSFIPGVKNYTRLTKCNKFLSITNPVTIEPPSKILSKGKEIIYVGRIEYTHKCTYRVVDIWNELEQLYPNWSLTIVGDGEDREDLQKRIDEYGLKNIAITGFVDPVKYYERASILLLTSDSEGFGLVIVEAMTYGLVPVVYNSYEAVRDIIIDGYNGKLVDKPYRINSFVTVLKDLMDGNECLNLISCNARNVSSRFTVDNVVNEWYELFTKE